MAPAIERWRFLLDRMPDKIAFLERLGTMLSAAGYHVQAVETFDRLLALDPYQADMHYRHGGVSPGFKRAFDIGEIVGTSPIHVEPIDLTTACASDFVEPL